MSNMQSPNADNKKTCLDLLYLADQALKETAADHDRIRAMDLNAVYQLARNHSMTAISYMALKHSGIFDDTDFMNQLPEKTSRCLKVWREDMAKAVRKAILMDVERGKLYTFMEEQRIWYLPLKGILIKEFYPEVGMRQMSDNDILFDPAYAETIRRYFADRGYGIEEYGVGNHDAYTKPPFYNFEMHRYLFNSKSGEKWQDYYNDMSRMMRPKEEGRMERTLSAEDYYDYTVAHAAKHFEEGGTGLRTLMDFALYQKQLGPNFRRSYVDRELQKLGLADFEHQLVALAEKIFDSEQVVYDITFTEEEQKMLFYVEDSGTYGTKEHSIANELQGNSADGASGRKAKMRYYLKRLFPGVKFMMEFYPICRKCPPLLPFVWLWRLLRGIFARNKKIRSEIRIVEQKERNQ